MTEERLRELLAPYLSTPGPKVFVPPPDLYSQLSAYLEVLLRWNARTNLTAIRDPEGIVKRHFGESVFAAAHLQPHVRPGGTLLDLGSGAGFPGLPIQLCHPGLAVTLAESQGKKASFLREAVRVLRLATEVWGARAEAMPPARRFDIVSLRAVDGMEAARVAARSKLAVGGLLVELTVTSEPGAEEPGIEEVSIPGSVSRVLRLTRR